jgi:hypothetical protein
MTLERFTRRARRQLGTLIRWASCAVIVLIVLAFVIDRAQPDEHTRGAQKCVKTGGVVSPDGNVCHIQDQFGRARDYLLP